MYVTDWYEKLIAIISKTKLKHETMSIQKGVLLYLSFCFWQIVPQKPNPLTNCSLLPVIRGLQHGIILSKEKVVTAPVWLRPERITWCIFCSLSTVRPRCAFTMILWTGIAFGMRTLGHVIRNMKQDTFQLLRTHSHCDYVSTIKFHINCSRKHSIISLNWSNCI